MTQPKSSHLVPQTLVDEVLAVDYFPDMDKAFLLLVAAGERQSMHTGYFTEWVPIDQPVPNTNTGRNDHFCALISRLGLKYKIQTKILERNDEGREVHAEWVVVCVAHDQMTADALYTARINNDARAEGLLLDIPPTAVEAYVNNTMLAIDDVPESSADVDTETMQLLNHRVSIDSWQDEVRYLNDYARKIKQISPELYQRCVEITA
jgi:hypothetical protein